MTARKQAQPSEMDKALKLIDSQIRELQQSISKEEAQIAVLRQMKSNFEDLQALSERKKAQ